MSNYCKNCYELQQQLKAKEQECEELKELCNGLDTTIDNYTNLIELRNQQLDQLKAENEELKEFLSKEPLAIQALQIGYADYKKRSEVFFEMIGKYKQTLTEIKEIAEKAKKDICNNCGWRNTDSCDPEDYTCGEFIKILQKISEVIPSEN